MSGIQLIIPLEALPEDTEMTVEGIMRTIGDNEQQRDAAEHYKAMYNSLVATVQSAGRSLKMILDEVDDEFHRVQALRNFATELTSIGTNVRMMP